MAIPTAAALHHTGFLVRDLETTARRLSDALGIIHEGSAGDGFDFGYVAFPEIGSLVELLYLDISKLPPPEAVIGPTLSPSAL